MSMRSALYFPHTTIRSTDLICTALLLWDRLEYIVPWSSFRADPANRNHARAMELIGAAHIPTHEEKQETHERLKEMMGRKLPPLFFVDRRRRQQQGRNYEVYAQKLLPETWDLLYEARLAGKLQDNSDYPLRELGGLLIMSILADCCAGTTRSRVTDRGDAYATLAGLIGNDPAAPKIRKADAHGQLVPISLKVIDASTVGIETLITLREREAKESSHSLRDLRHSYVESLENYVTRLVGEKTTKSDAENIKREFQEDMERDLRRLRRELGFAGKEALFSKEMFATVLTTVGTAASWVFGAPLHLEGVVSQAGIPAAIGGLLRTRNKYLEKRQSVLEKHPMAYLYEADAAAFRK
jgi:hypothetical protein